MLFSFILSFSIWGSDFANPWASRSSHLRARIRATESAVLRFDSFQIKGVDAMETVNFVDMSHPNLIRRPENAFYLCMPFCAFDFVIRRGFYPFSNRLF